MGRKVSFGCLVIGEIREIRDSRSMGQEVVDGDFLPRSGTFRNVAADRPLNIEFALSL